MNEERVCSKCLMDSSVPRIHFDKDGVCSYCHFHNALDAEYQLGPETDARLERIYDRARAQGRNKSFDCIVGVSGGRDSTFLLWHLTKVAGLRCLPVFFNDGFGNPVAGENMKKATRALGLPMRTVSADWRESKDLKIACLKASIPDLNLATDIGLGNALYGAAASEGVRTIFIGQSFRTEGIAPLEWNYLDGRYLKAIHDQFGSNPLRPWKSTDPGFHMSWQHILYYAAVRRIHIETPLYYINYVRSEADKLLKKEMDWVNTGAHYYDDLYQALLTRVLRVKFSIDRRKFNYSALIRSGQMSREEGRRQIMQPYIIEDDKVIDLCIKRLGISREEFETFMAAEPKTFWDYPNLLNVIRKFSPVVRVLAALQLIPLSSYMKYCRQDV
jgi:hypothetical protein